MQKKSVVAVLVMVFALAVASVPMFAQAAQQSLPGASAQPSAATEQDVQMLRADLRAQRKDITAQNLQLTPDQATKFWPLYDQYTQEQAKIGDARWALIKDFATNYNTLTDVQANAYINKSAAIDKQFIDLRLKYVGIFEKVVPAKVAAQWAQIDRRLDLLVNLQLASVIPLVSATK